MSNGSNVIEIPVVTRNVSRNKSEIIASTVCFLLPDMTETALAKNEQYVRQIKKEKILKQSGSGKSKADFFVPGFIFYTSTLNYRVTYADNSVRVYDLISFKLDREIYTMAPFARVHDATVTVTQSGASGEPVDFDKMLIQSKDFGTIEYGTLYPVRENWTPVCSVQDASKVDVVYKVFIDYANKDDYTLEFTHKAK